MKQKEKERRGRGRGFCRAMAGGRLTRQEAS